MGGGLRKEKGQREKEKDAAMALTDGAARERIAAQDLAALRSAGVLVEDPRRQRPRYFDGRFLAARDLIRDQQYFLTRESDLGQAAGSGIAVGLFVRQGTEAQSLAIAPGHGVTPAGELVLLPREMNIALADVAAAEHLSARFGLSRRPQPPMRSRTGLFVLGLRPVEFTANPIGAYPTSITGQRTVEDGDVVEATAVVLVPWNDDGAVDALEARRGQAAHAIFVAGLDRGMAASVLPLAMIALQNNTIVWIDEPMVRRELGADRADLPGLGFSPRALRLAHVLQHQRHLAEVLAAAGTRPFPAASRFPALPPAGPLPPGAINPADFTQSYFPAEIDVDFSIIPDDELPALIEDALALPPIDLTLPSEALDSSAVAILAPVPRNEWRAVTARLTSRVRPIRPAAPNLVAQRKPLETLLRLRPLVPILPLPDPADPADAEWQRLARFPTLWFVRRRQLADRADVTGASLRFGGVEDPGAIDRVRDRLTNLGLAENLDRVLGNASPAAALEVTRLLASPRFADSPALTAATLGELAARAEPAGSLDSATAVAVSSALTATGAGDGLARLEASRSAPLDAGALVRLAAGTEWRAVDAELKAAPKEALPGIATERLGVVRDTPARPERPRTPSPPRRDARPRAERGKAGPAKARRKRKKGGEKP
jgi:hypothetical protein